jgi:hypothetical protein
LFARGGKPILLVSTSALLLLVIVSGAMGWPRGRRKDKDDDKEKRPWTYASGALAQQNVPMRTDSAPDLGDDLHAASGSKVADKGLAVGGADQPGEPPQVGDPLAAAKMRLLEQEMITGLRSRNIYGDFQRFRSYLGSMLYGSSGAYTGELTGNCRLSWYAHLLRDPIHAPVEAEQFTRELHQAVLLGPQGFAQVLATARRKLDLPDRPLVKFRETHSAAEALEVVKEALVGARTAHAAALAPLSKSELNELVMNLYPVLCSQNIVGHTLNDRATGRRMCDLLEKMDRDAMFRAAEALAPLISKDLLHQLAKIPEEGDVSVPGVSGRVLQKIDTPAGAIIIGGRGPNVYRLDEMPTVACVIDLGGDDTYYEGSTTLERPVLAILDLAGSNTYRGRQPGIQGGAILGASILVDLEGNDVYEAQDVAQGSCIGGVGILVNYGGKNRYHGLRRCQGSALAGLGILLDFGGNDDYHAAMWSQGFGHPLGFGLLDDVAGNDHYYLGGMWRDSYPETPGYEGWGQGVGAGIRQVADGGIGVLLDGGGHDVYEFDYIAHGGGYWCGVGFARDFGGDNQYIGSTYKAYDGGPRSQPEFQRFGCGFGCHYSLGFCFDDSGNSYYRGTIMNQGFGWDCSVGVLCDFGGKNKYEAPPSGNSAQGQGAQCSLGVLFDYGGHDTYIGYGQGFANPGINYHAQPECGGNFSFLVDYGDNNTYGCGAQNGTYIQRGSAGGFIIDRPAHAATTENAKSPKPGPKIEQTTKAGGT